jgi:hypothetical protein
MGRLALPILALATACSPLKDYQEAARTLRFHLDRVEPSLRLTLPVDRSRVQFHILLGVENPSTVPFHVVGFTGDLKLETAGATRGLGRLDLTRPLDLPAGGTAQLDADLSFSYGELRDNWAALDAVAKGAPGIWHLEGTLKAQAYGVPLQLPVRTSRSFGGGG